MQWVGRLVIAAVVAALLWAWVDARPYFDELRERREELLDAMPGTRYHHDELER